MQSLNLMRAEWRKMTGNQMLASFTLWIYPVGAAIFILVMGVLVNIVPGDPANSPFTTAQWTDAAMGAWAILLKFPATIMIRLPMIAFMAIAFAGEYEWNTWKGIVPRTRRSALLIAKFLTLSVLIVLSLLATSLLWTAGRAVIAAVFGAEFGPEMTNAVFAEFIKRYVLEIWLAFAMTLVLGGFTALAVMLTRSMIGGLLLGFGLSVAEALSGTLFALFSTMLQKPTLVNAYAFLPGYAIDNIRSWVIQGQVLAPPGFTAEPTLLASIIVLAVWIVGGMAISLMLFERQDLVS